MHFGHWAINILLVFHHWMQQKHGRAGGDYYIDVPMETMFVLHIKAFAVKITVLFVIL